MEGVVCLEHTVGLKINSKIFWPPLDATWPYSSPLEH